MDLILRGKIIDTMVAAAVVNENRFSYSLNSLGFDLLGEIKSEAFLNEKAKEWGLDPKQDLWRMPAGFVGHYAEQDAALTYKLWQYFKPIIIKENLQDVFDMEMDLLPILIDMRMTGLRVDLDKIKILKKEFITDENKILKEIKEMTGMGVDIWG
jgi:DNA polymerase I